MSATKRARRRDRDDVRVMFIKTITLLRALLKREAPKILAQFPGHRRPCHTCAFNPATDRDRGFDSTILHLSEALVKDRPFYCHEPMPKDASGDWMFDPKTATLCAGVAMLSGAAQDAKRAVVRGMIPTEIPDTEADFLLEHVRDTFVCSPERKVAPGVTEEELRPYR